MRKLRLSEKLNPIGTAILAQLIQQFCGLTSIKEIFERQIGMRHLNAKLVVNPMDEFSETSTELYSNLDEIVKMAFIGTLDVEVKGSRLLQVLSRTLEDQTGIESFLVRERSRHH